ncbi:MAG TPA: tetratricopeptide repeat protein [Chthonomonadaceae bacterium]|nr:tetratricopeptide repeat protein [Chthonomonadaceae bacterium]
MQLRTEATRYVRLTEAGLKRLEEARRKYRKTIDDIVGDRNTPSINTVKRVFKQGPVFLDTLERIWDYLQRCAEENKATLPYLISGEDYVFVEGTPRADNTPRADTKVKEDIAEALPSDSRWGWLSRQVPGPNRLFTGRRNILDRLHTALKAGSAALVPDPQALTGLGGIGKTQTAIAYIYEHRNDYNGVYWVSAETVEALNEGLASLAEELKLLTPGPTTQREALQKMHDWFQNESDWLLVLDNADDIATLAPHFPRHHTGSLLVTTRARNTVKWAVPIELLKFNRTEGALLLLRRAGVLDISQTLDDALPNVAQAAMELSDELEGLPLALDQAGAYISETMMTVPEYLAVYRKYGLPLLDKYRDRDHKSVTVTFRLALEQVARRSRYGQAAVELVRLCAFLAPDAIPEAIFTSYPFAQNDGPSPLDTVDYYFEVSAAACGYSLLSRYPENKTLSVHRLVQRVMRETMSAEERRLWIERAVRAVSDATPDFEFEEWSLCDLFLPHWRLCAEYVKELNLETPEAAYLLYQAGRYLRARALYGEAEALMRRALAIAEKVYGAQHRTTADYLDALACLYRELDRCEEAEPLHERALKIVEEVEGPEHSETAGKLHNMALLYMEQKDFAKAEAFFLRVLAIREKQQDDENLLAAALTQLAGVYRYQGSFDKAEPYSRRALQIYENALKPNHINIATGCNNLGLLCINLGRYTEAEELFLRALKINEEWRGNEHPETGTVIWGLAIVRWKQDQFKEAGELFRQAIRIYEKNYGQGHSRLTRLLSFYADFQQDAGHTG